MRKLVFFLLVLCSTLLSFSQEKITNESHPFQVLFVDSANYIGMQEPVNQFDFLSEDNLIKVNGEIVLVHFTGKISVLKDLTFEVSDLSKIRHKKGFFLRPIISHPTSTQNSSSNYRMRLNPNSAVKICGPAVIKIIYPIITKDAEIISDISKDEVHLVWEAQEEFDDYFIRFANIFDKELYSATTEATQIKVPRTYFSNEGLVIVEIKTSDQKHTSSAFAMKFEKLPAVKKHYKMIDALQEQWIGNKYVARLLFLDAIEQSNQDPRFIQLYEDFLQRNPEFKESSE